MDDLIQPGSTSLDTGNYSVLITLVFDLQFRIFQNLLQTWPNNDFLISLFEAMLESENYIKHLTSYNIVNSNKV